MARPRKADKAKKSYRLIIRLNADERLRYAVLRRQIHEKLHTVWGKREHKLQIFTEITRLRRFCCHPRLVFPDAPSESSKLAALFELVEELRQIHKGGGFGTIMGRNAFQRTRSEGAALLKTAIQIFGGKA